MPHVPVVDADLELDDGRNLAYCSWGLGRECSLLGSRGWRRIAAGRRRALLVKRIHPVT